MRQLVVSILIASCAALGFVESAPAQSPLPKATATPAPNALEVEVLGMRNDHGQVGCSLFNDPPSFPRDESKVIRHAWAPIHGGKAICEFPGLAAGEYAAVVYHDENGNGKFDENFLGMPKEGFGFSRDAPARLSAPTFDEANFKYDGKHLRIPIHIRYWPL